MKRITINNIVRPYAKPSNAKALWQLANTLLPYFALIALMYWLLQAGVHYLFVLPISILPALFLVRIFILFHDCTHSSFMSSKKWMTVIGHVLGILTFTSYHQWQREHLTHHRTVGNLEKRGVGDVWTMTVDEYQRSSWIKRLGYRLYRHPFFLFGIGPFYMFVINQRLPLAMKTKKDWISLLITNLGILAIVLTVSFTVGLQYYIMIQLPIIFIASSLGVWLFFVQHQYEEVYWAESDEWDITEAALKGSSVYKLPRILDWFTGNIAYHNVHHLNARIPNYNLRTLFHSTKAFRNSKEINIKESIHLAMLYLYDERLKKLISRKTYKKQYN